MFIKELTYHQKYYRNNKDKYKKGGKYYKYKVKENNEKFKVEHKKIIINFD